MSPPGRGAVPVTRAQVLAFRAEVHQLYRDEGALADTAILDLGVQDTGPDGALWALAVRGVDVTSVSDEDVVLLWTLRGAPHLYRRADLAQLGEAVAPFSDADAGKRLISASKALKAAGIGNLEAIDAVAEAMRRVVTAPMVKGEVSTRLTALMPDPYLRYCGPCGATHLYEMPFRLAVVRAGLELERGTSPPVLRPVRGRPRRAASASPGSPGSAGRGGELDVVRGTLHLLGPLAPKHVAGFIEAPVKDVTARWPKDAVEVSLDGERRWALEQDVEELTRPERRTRGAVPGVRLLGPYDLYLQARDRDLLVTDPARAKELWPVLGRPGVVIEGSEVVGSWRPRTAGRHLTMAVRSWRKPAKGFVRALEEQAGRLSDFRGLTLKSVEVESGP